MFNIYFLVLLHKVFDCRCFWVGALIGAVTGLISTGITAGTQAKQMKQQGEQFNKQMEMQQKQLDAETKKYNDSQKAQAEAGKISADAINSTSPSQSGGISGTIGSISDSSNISGQSGLGLDNKESSFLRS